VPRLPSTLRRWLLPLDAASSTVDLAPAVPIREIFRRFWPYGRDFRRWLWFSLLLAPIGPAIEAANIWLFKLVIDRVLVPGDLGPLPPLIALYAALAVAGGAIGFASTTLTTWLSQRFVLTMRTRFFAHLQTLPLDFFERRRLGDVIARLTGDVAAVETLVLSGVGATAFHVTAAGVFAVAALLLDWQLALACFLLGPLFLLAVRRLSRLLREAARERRRRSGSISALAEETLGSIALVQAYNREETERERFHAAGESALRAQMASTRIRALYTPVTDALTLAGTLLVVALGTWEVSRGRLSVGGLLAFIAYLTQLYRPVRSLSRMDSRAFTAAAAAERILEFLDARPAVADRPYARPLRTRRGRLELDDVTFRYPGTEADALDGVSLTVEPGETLALVGPSGAGKSTIAKLALRFYDPARGTVLLDGNDVRELTLASLREHIALLMQEALVLDGTVRENIAYGRAEADEEDVVAAAVAADAHEFVMRLPDGYATRVGQRGRLLSGGQRQRLAIARAMVRDAPLLILDEPTTGLDPESSDRILEPLRRLMADRSVLVISHSLAIARRADRIVVVEGGRVTATGEHAELAAGDGYYARLCRSEAALR
jgi:ABC-type multidrug transport system fused ATPase/permease subunit